MPVEEVGPGRTFGSYEILEELGRGGMGRVFLARHVTLDREVALKLLAEQYTGDDYFVQRFLKEARAAARLNHPGIVQIYDFGQVGPHWYLAMEYVDGRSLAYFLRKLGRFSEKDVISLARQTLPALGVAHAAGIVHRDVKPDNLILGGKGVVKLVDLGLAKKVDDPGASATGYAAGTPFYISPEQIEGRPDVDGRADLYSLGATLFHLATGRVPFPGPSSAVIMSRHLNERAPDPRSHVPELTAGFSAAILRLLARERDRRPPTAEDADRDFAALQGDSPLRVTDVLRTIETDGESRQAPPDPGPDWSEDVRRFLEERLAERVGPLARILVRQAAAESDGFEALCRRLAAQIPGEAQAREFLREVLSASSSSHPSGPGSGTPGGSPGPAGATRASGPSQAGAQPTPGAGSLSPELLAAAEQRLAVEIGPLARVLVRREAKKHASWTALVEALSAHVPEEAGRRRLREALGALGV